MQANQSRSGSARSSLSVPASDSTDPEIGFVFDTLQEHQSECALAQAGQHGNRLTEPLLRSHGQRRRGWQMSGCEPLLNLLPQLGPIPLVCEYPLLRTMLLAHDGSGIHSGFAAAFDDRRLVVQRMAIGGPRISIPHF